MNKKPITVKIQTNVLKFIHIEKRIEFINILNLRERNHIGNFET